MPDQAVSPVVEAKIVENVLAATQQFQRLCLGLARKGHGFEINVHGKGESELTISYTVHVGKVVVM